MSKQEDEAQLVSAAKDMITLRADGSNPDAPTQLARFQTQHKLSHDRARSIFVKATRQLRHEMQPKKE